MLSMSTDLNGDAHRSVVQCRIDKADENWRDGKKDEAFVGVLNLVALMSSAISQLSRSYLTLAEELAALRKKDE